MKNEEPYSLCSFVARFWLERGTPGIPIWRGHIRHVQSEKQMHFQDLKEMCDFVEQVSGFSGPPRSAIEISVTSLPEK